MAEGSPKTAAKSAESIDLPAPDGWTKKFTPKKRAFLNGEITYVSPTGEEIRSRRQLIAYLKSHPGGPPLASFDWTTGDTPRRSARIVEKHKDVETPPEEERPKKRSRKSLQPKDTGSVPPAENGSGEQKETAPTEAPAAEETKAATTSEEHGNEATAENGSAEPEAMDVEKKEDVAAEGDAVPAEEQDQEVEAKQAAEEHQDDADRAAETVKDGEKVSAGTEDVATLASETEEVAAAVAAVSETDAENEKAATENATAADTSAEKESVEGADPVETEPQKDDLCSGNGAPAVEELPAAVEAAAADEVNQ